MHYEKTLKAVGIECIDVYATAKQAYTAVYNAVYMAFFASVLPLIKRLLFENAVFHRADYNCVIIFAECLKPRDAVAVFVGVISLLSCRRMHDALNVIEMRQIGLMRLIIERNSFQGNE